MPELDLLSELGPLALGSRLRRLTERLAQDVSLVYKEQALEFEPRWFPVVYLLSRQSAVAITDIAKLMGVSHPAVNQIAGELIRHGLVKALKDTSDKRKRLLALTPKGRDLLPQLQEVWNDVHVAVREVLAGCDIDVMAALSQLERSLDERSLYARFSDRRSRKLQDGIEIIEYEPRLREAFKTLNTEWIQRYFRMEPEDERVLGDPEGQILQDGGKILFARKLNADGTEEILGTCALVRKKDGMLELAKMGVTERARGHKIGSRLLDAAIIKARAMGARMLVLDTNSRLASAIHLYKKAGFQPAQLEEEPHYERSDMHMRLPL